MRMLGRNHWMAFGAAMLLALLGVARASANVSVSSFTAKAQTTQIQLTWKTASEVSNAGFNIYRSTSSTGPWTNKLNPNLIPACPGCALGASYSYNDTTALKGQTYYYRLESVEFNGTTQPFGPASAQISASATTTPTTIPPTPTQTATLAPPTATNTSVPGLPTATVYNSPIPPGAPAPTETPVPTRVAYVVGQPSLTPVPAPIVKSAPPKSNPPNPGPAPVNVIPSPKPSGEPPANSATNLGSTDSPSGPESAPAEPPAQPSMNLLGLGLVGIAGLFAIFALALGAVSLYLIAHRFVR